VTVILPNQNQTTIIAVLVSLVLHMLTLVTWQNRESLSRIPVIRTMMEVLSQSHTASLKQVRVQEPIPTITFIEEKVPEIAPEPAKIFIETDAAQVTGEEPKEAKFYSDKPTVAANPVNPTGKVGDTPYLEGTETRMASTENVPRPQPAVVLPPPPVAIPKAVTVKPSLPKPVEPIADKGTTVVRDQPPVAAQPAAPPPMEASPAMARVMVPPGSSRELSARQSKLTVSGTARSGVAAFNVASSPFGAYDQKIVRAVQSRWYALIEKYGIYERSGMVTIQFQLHDDGTVHDVKRAQNQAGEILALFCEKAILESQPFEPLPDNLRTLIGKDPREVNFTFYY
jgi:hypothetical protein